MQKRFEKLTYFLNGGLLGHRDARMGSEKGMGKLHLFATATGDSQGVDTDIDRPAS